MAYSDRDQLRKKELHLLRQLEKRAIRAGAGTLRGADLDRLRAQGFCYFDGTHYRLTRAGRLCLKSFRQPTLLGGDQ